MEQTNVNHCCKDYYSKVFVHSSQQAGRVCECPRVRCLPKHPVFEANTATQH